MYLVQASKSKSMIPFLYYEFKRFVILIYNFKVKNMFYVDILEKNICWYLTNLEKRTKNL